MRKGAVASEADRGADVQISRAARWAFRWLFPLAFLVVGGLVLVFGLIELSRGFASTGWPSAEGRIVSSVIDMRRSSSDQGTTTFHADIRYEYTVAGADYVGTRVAIGDFGTNRRAYAVGIMARYPEGASVEVFYEPDSPAVSLLEPGVTLKAYFMPAFGAAFIGFGVLAFFVVRLVLPPSRSES